MNKALKFQGRSGDIIYDIVINSEAIVAFDLWKDMYRVYLKGGQTISVLASPKTYNMLIDAIESK